MSTLNSAPVVAVPRVVGISKHLILAAALLLLEPFTADAVPAAALSDADKVEWQWGVKIPLRDGVHLNATLYKPAAITIVNLCVRKTS
jgi:predicted acyl esterase